MQCLNIKNPEVAALLEEYTKALGSEEAAYYVLSENDGLPLDRVPVRGSSTGESNSSKLFNDLLEYYKGDKQKAIVTKSQIYTESFKQWFENSKEVDENEEPLMSVLVNKSPISQNVESSTDTYEINKKISKLKTAYDSAVKLRDSLRESVYGSRSAAWTEIRNLGLESVCYPFPSNGKYRIAVISKNSFNDELQELTNSLENTYYGELSTDELLSRAALEEQDRNLSSTNVSEDYLNWLNTEIAQPTPAYEDYASIFSAPVSVVNKEAVGSDKTLVSRIFGNKSIITAEEALNRINGENTKALSELLKPLLNTLLKGVTIHYEPTGSRETGSSAVYHEDYHKIIIYGDSFFKGKGAIADTTILHELIHAATVARLALNPELNDSVNRILDSARKQLTEKYGLPWEEIIRRDLNRFYGLTNSKEFLSELFSNATFIRELSTLEAEGEVKPINFLKSIVNWLLSLFSANRDNKTLYEQAAAELEQVLFGENLVDLAFEDRSYFTLGGEVSRNLSRTSDTKQIKNILSTRAKEMSFDPSTHTYTYLITGEIYTPVSTVKDNQGYGADLSSMSDDILVYGERCAEIGTMIHDEIHSILTKEKTEKHRVNLSKGAKKSLTSIIEKLFGKDYEVIASEQMISNDSAKIAGTIDLLVKDKTGKIHLVDFKTKARTFEGNAKYGFDYYFSARKETKTGGKPDASRHDYQLSLYKRMLELMGIQVDSKEIVPLEYNVDETGQVTDIWVPDLDYSQPNGTIYHRTNNALEQDINNNVLFADNTSVTNHIETENLHKQSMIVSDILKVLKNQLALYRVKGRTTKAEVLKKFIEELNSKEEIEVLISYVHKAVELLNPIIEEYNAKLDAERRGEQNVWSLKSLEAWKNYAESFDNLSSIQDYLFLNAAAFEKALNKNDLHKLREALATALDYKNHLENAYKAKGESIWLDWLTPFSTRIEAEYREKAEKEYRKKHKGSTQLNDTAAMNRYIEQYVNSHRAEIEAKSRNLLRSQSKIAESSPVGSFSKWVATIFDSSDPIVGSMARAYHTRWMESLDEFNGFYKKLVDLTKALEYAFPNLANDPAKLYDFMIEQDEFGTTLISKFPASFNEAYALAKKEILSNPEYETSKDKARAISKWLTTHAPISNEIKLRKSKLEILTNLLSIGKITKAEFNILNSNEKRDPKDRRSWADMVEKNQISEEVADYLRVKFNELNWEYRKPNPKLYKNDKWNKLEEIRRNNPSDVRVQFYDFINELASYGDSRVPDRFKLNGRLPGMSKRMSEHFSSNGLKVGLTEVLRKELTITADDTDRGMSQMTDELDRPIKFVPIFFTNTLPNKDQSLDIATIYKEWFRSVNNYHYINEILPQLQYTKWVVENRKTIKTDSQGNPIKNILSSITRGGESDIDPTTNTLITDNNLIDQLNHWFDQVVYGESSTNMGSTLGIDRAKALDLFQKFTSLKVMAVNFTSMMNNAIVAEAQQAEEAFAGQYISAKSYNEATAYYFNHLPDVLGDIGARKPTSLINLLNEHFGLRTYTEGSMQDNTKAKKLMDSSTLYFTTNMGEHEVQSRFLIAALKEKRALDKNGNDIGAMFDYFSKVDGKLVFDPEHKVANFSRKDQIAFSQWVGAVLRRMHGNYSPYSKVAIQHFGFGRMAIMFRKWIWDTYQRRFASKYYDEFGQSFNEGFYKTGGSFYAHKVQSFFLRFVDELRALEIAEKADWDTMTNQERANVKRFTTEVAIWALTNILSLLLSYVDIDEEDYPILSKAVANLDYQLYRFGIDLTFYINPISTLKIIQSPIPSSSVIKQIGNLFESILDPLAVYEKGDWKGELKIKKRVMDLLPIVRQLYRIANIETEKQMLSII